MTRKEIKKWCSEHSFELACVGITGLAVVATIAKAIINSKIEPVLDMPVLERGNLSMFKDKDEYCASVDTITVDDLGKLGEALCKLDDIKPDSLISAEIIIDRNKRML